MICIYIYFSSISWPSFVAPPFCAVSHFLSCKWIRNRKQKRTTDESDAKTKAAKNFFNLNLTFSRCFVLENGRLFRCRLGNLISLQSLNKCRKVAFYMAGYIFLSFAERDSRESEHSTHKSFSFSIVFDVKKRVAFGEIFMKSRRTVSTLKLMGEEFPINEIR